MEQLQDLEQLEVTNQAAGKRLQEVCDEAEALLREIRESIRVIATTQGFLLSYYFIISSQPTPLIHGCSGDPAAGCFLS